MVEIRQYQDVDLESLTELMSDLGYPTAQDKMRKRMEIIQRLPLYYTFIAIKDTHIIGMIGCREVYYYEEDGLAIQISALVTKKDYQGKGIGRAMVMFVEQWARDKGANSLYLTSGARPERKKAHEFYAKNGFEVTGYRFVKNLKS